MDESRQAPDALPEISSAEQQSRNWSMFAQLAFLADYLIPFAGLITLILIYTQIGGRDRQVRRNAGEALGLQVSVLAVSLAIIIAMAIVGVVIALINKPAAYVAVALMVAAIFGLMVYRFVAGIMAAIKAGRGEPVHYTYSVIRFGAEGQVDEGTQASPSSN